METSRLSDCLAQEYMLLRDAAASVDLGVPVPTCPGWVMGDLVHHVATVYLHKVTVMRTGEWPRPWPPAGLNAEPALALLGRAFGELVAEFRVRDPAQVTPTWYELDETVGFWLRRMTQETVVHRIDAELAAGLPSARVPDDLALDGVDEVLTRFLGYFFPEGDVPPLAGPAPDGGSAAALDGGSAIVVSTGGRSWTVRPSPPGEVTVVESGDGGGDYRALVSGPPDPMLRWLWGRAGTSALTVAGDQGGADYLRRLLVATTQ